MNSKIPIFPLNIVMFPGSVYPLHIFEERYKRLIRRCVAENSGFGIVAKIDTRTSEVGCYVFVSEIIKKYENGSMDIYVKGTERFKTLRTSIHQDGYLEADIVPFSDIQDERFDYDRVNLLLKRFQSLMQLTRMEPGENYWKNLKATERKSFKIAEKSGMTLKDQQKLLGLKSESKRIELLIEHLEKVEIYIQKSAELNQIVIGNGYIN